jgi:hypothetical protein
LDGRIGREDLDFGLRVFCGSGRVDGEYGKEVGGYGGEGGIEKGRFHRIFFSLAAVAEAARVEYSEYRFTAKRTWR